MSLTAKTWAAESGHWYTRDGVPAYTTIGVNGRERYTTLRDARKLNLVPSVTTIINVMAKPGLDVWKQKQLLMAALTLTKADGETEDDYISRIVTDSKEQGRRAADAGTAIHASAQAFYEGKSFDPVHDKHIDACDRIITEKLGVHQWIAERAFSHELGYGGKCDLYVPAGDGHGGMVVDIKTKEFSDGSKVEAYDEHAMQLAAYRIGLGVPEARCANVFISRDTPGLVVNHEWAEGDILKGWSMFLRLLEFWQIKNNHE